MVMSKQGSPVELRGKDFQRLIGLARDIAPTDEIGWNYAFMDIGLALNVVPRMNSEWAVGPVYAHNLAVFGSTGGDSVHYGFVCDEPVVDDRSPVVMVVPCAWGRDNMFHIVGGSLAEFLALGTGYGYFAIEQLAYDYEKTVSRIGAAVPYRKELSDKEQRQLDLVRQEFGLVPWKNVGKRLAELDTLFFDRLKIVGE